MYQIGWFSTGRDQAASDLLATVQEAIQQGHITAQIAFVFSNCEPSESPQSDLFFKLVKSYHIPLRYYSSAKFKANLGQDVSWRLKYDREVMKHLEGFQPDLCVLAGYMLIVGEEMCHRYDMINLHPAAPGGPAGTWQEVIWQLMEQKATKTGVMMHLVTPELDRGPVVTYCTFAIKGKPFDRYWKEIEGHPLAELQKQGETNPLFCLIRQHGLAREFPLIVATIKAFSQGKVRVANKKVVDAQGKVLAGYDLTEEIDALVKDQLPCQAICPEAQRD